MKQDLFWGNRDSPFITSLILSIGSLIIYFLFVGHPVWGTNDDVLMSMISAGVWFSNQPSADLLFIHPFYGEFVSNLCRWIPNLPWYSISFVLILSFSLIAFNYSILRLQRNLYTIILLTFTSIAIATPSLWHLQFTIIAGLSSFAGLALLLSFLMFQPPSRVERIIIFVSSLLLLLFGGMIRFDSMLLVVILVVPTTISIFIMQLASREFTKKKKSLTINFLLFIFVIFFTILSLKISSYNYYNSSLEWQRWFKLNELKAEFIDYNRIKYDDNTKQIFDQVGWSKNDYEMIVSWQYVDPKYFSLDKFRFVVNQTKSQLASSQSSINLASQEVDRKPWLQQMLINTNIRARKSFSNFFLPLLDFLKQAPTLTFCMIIVGMLIVYGRNRFTLVCLVSILCSVIAVQYYLTFELNRAIFRVLMPCFVTALGTMLLFKSYYRDYTQSIKTRFFLNAKVSFLCTYIILVILVAHTLFELNNANRFVGLKVDLHQLLEARIQSWKDNLPKDSLIYNIGANFPYENHLPLSSFNSLRSVKGFIGTGTLNQSPIQMEVLKSLDLDQDFYLSLSKNKFTYIVGSRNKDDDAKMIDILTNYYREHYDINVLFAEEPNLPDLYKLVFKNKDYQS